MMCDKPIRTITFTDFCGDCLRNNYTEKEREIKELQYHFIKTTDSLYEKGHINHHQQLMLGVIFTYNIAFIDSLLSSDIGDKIENQIKYNKGIKIE